jgi:hypothetical protein
MVVPIVVDNGGVLDALYVMGGIGMNIDEDVAGGPGPSGR